MTRNDLPSAYIAPQAVHAAARYAIEHPKCFRTWHDISQYIVILGVDTPDKLYELNTTLTGTVPFVEPDIGYEMTAFAVVPTGSARRKHLKRLPLATGDPDASLTSIREARALYSSLPEIDWTPRPTWESDREDFRKELIARGNH